MAQYTADFSGDTVGLAPAGWTELDGAGDGTPTWLVATDTSGAGGKVLELNATTNVSRYLELDSSLDGNTGAMDVRVKFKTPSGGYGAAEDYGFVAVYNETDITEDSEMIRLFLEYQDDIRLEQFLYFDAPGAVLWSEEIHFHWVGDTWYQARLKVDPATNTAQAKVWRDTDAEPDFWMVEKTDPAILSFERSAGLYTHSTQTTFPHIWDYMIVNTDGGVPDETDLPVTTQVRANQASVEVMYNFTSPEVRVNQASVEVMYGGSPDSTGGDGGGDGSSGYLDGASQPYIRAWGFTLDGHDYYVLNLPLETLVYDFHSGQWYNWGSESYRVWAALEGINWYGNIGRLLTLYGNTSITQSLSTVLVGDNSNGSLYFLDPTLPHDSDRTGVAGTYNVFERFTYGQITVRGWNYEPCDSFQLTGSVGEANATASAVVTLEYSDDAGHTFVNAGDLTITEGDYSQRMEWPSLGSYQKPGRLFRVTDYGALQRIDGMEVHEHGS